MKILLEDCMWYLTDTLDLNVLLNEGFVVLGTDAETVKSMMHNGKDKEWESYVQDQNNADLLSDLLEIKIEVNKKSINVDKFTKFDKLLTFKIEHLKNEDVVIFYIIPILPSHLQSKMFENITI